MKNYLFETPEFGVSDMGVHLLRSGYNYETIHWRELNSVKIEKGRELQNWWIIFLIGLGLLVVGIYLMVRTIDILIHKEQPQNYIKMLQFFLIPMIGVYFTYNSLQTGTLVKINYANSKKSVFPLRQIVKENRMEAFKSLIEGKTGKVLLS